MGRVIPFPEARRAAVPLSPATDEGAAALEEGRRWGEWMALAQRGDRAIYHQLLREVAPYLRAVARRYLGQHHEAEDAVQEILIVVHDIRHTYEPDRPFKPWLRTIATRRCIDSLRKRTRRLQHELADDDGAHQATCTDATPEEHLENDQDRRTLELAMQDLSPRQREALRLLRIDELSLREASLQSEQSIGSLKVALHRAVKALQRNLAHKEGQ